MTTAAGPITTAEQLLRAGDIGRCELVRGELIMMSPASYGHGRYAGRLARALGEFVESRGLGEILTAEPGFVLSRHPDTVRAPDVAFVRAERARQAPERGYFEGAPDLAVEVLSPDDRASEVLEKVQEYLSAGSQAVWVVDPRSKTITAYGRDQQAHVYRGEDTLDGGGVLPEFKLPLAELFGV